MHDLGFAQRICTWRILKLREKSGNFILVDLGRCDGPSWFILWSCLFRRKEEYFMNSVRNS